MRPTLHISTFSFLLTSCATNYVKKQEEFAFLFRVGGWNPTLDTVHFTDPQAVRLASVYDVPLAVFISSNKQPIYVNNGSGTYNNSVNCYIGTYSGDVGLKDLVKELVEIIRQKA